MDDILTIITQSWAKTSGVFVGLLIMLFFIRVISLPSNLIVFASMKMSLAQLKELASECCKTKTVMVIKDLPSQMRSKDMFGLEKFEGALLGDVSHISNLNIKKYPSFLFLHSSSYTDFFRDRGVGKSPTYDTLSGKYTLKEALEHFHVHSQYGRAGSLLRKLKKGQNATSNKNIYVLVLFQVWVVVATYMLFT